MTTARKPTQRAFDDWRTTCAARSGVSSTLRVCGGAAEAFDWCRLGGRSGDREALLGLEPGLVAHRSPRSKSGRGRSASDASGRRARRDQAGLAERDRQWSERDLAGVDRQRARPIDRDREAVHAPRRRAELGAVGLDPEPVVARAVARAFEPEVLEARVRLAAEVRAALVQRPDVEGLPLPAVSSPAMNRCWPGSYRITNARASG